MSGTQQKWRETTTAPGAVTPRRNLVLGLLLIGLAVAAIVVFLLPYLRPPARVTLVPLFVPPYRGAPPDALAWRAQERDALTEGSLFFSTAQPVGSLSQQALLQELSERREGHALVYYISALARTGPGGKVCLLPADADPLDPATWLPLARVLEVMKRQS
jgi:hypothetical protein